VSKFEVKRSKFKVAGNEHVKIINSLYLCQKWINLHQTKTKMIPGPFYTYRWVHFTSRNASFFCDNL